MLQHCLCCLQYRALPKTMTVMSAVQPLQCKPTVLSHGDDDHRDLNIYCRTLYATMRSVCCCNGGQCERCHSNFASSEPSLCRSDMDERTTFPRHHHTKATRAAVIGVFMPLEYLDQSLLSLAIGQPLYQEYSVRFGVSKSCVVVIMTHSFPRSQSQDFALTAAEGEACSRSIRKKQTSSCNVAPPGGLVDMLMYFRGAPYVRTIFEAGS
jgi:hypothetical protein